MSGCRNVTFGRSAFRTAAHTLDVCYCCTHKAERTETFQLTGTVTTSNTSNTSAAGTATITNDDATPTASIAVSPSSVKEDGGGSGADILDGGSGFDTLQGGSGADTLIFKAYENQFVLGGTFNATTQQLTGGTTYAHVDGTVVYTNGVTPASNVQTLSAFGGYDKYDGGNGAAYAVDHR